MRFFNNKNFKEYYNMKDNPYFQINRIFSLNMTFIGAKSRHRDVAAIICGFDNHQRPCYTTNQYFHEIAAIHKRTVSDVITELKEHGLITVTYQPYQDGTKRLLTPTSQLKQMQNVRILNEALKNTFKCKRAKAGGSAVKQ